MTIEEMKNSKCEMLTPQDVSEVLQMHPSRIRLCAQKGQLPFPCIRSGSRTKIPRLAFLKWGGWIEQTENI